MERLGSSAFINTLSTSSIVQGMRGSLYTTLPSGTVGDENDNAVIQFGFKIANYMSLDVKARFMLTYIFICIG